MTVAKKFKLIPLVLIVPLLFSSCSSAARFPIEIADVNVSQPPAVGRTIDLQIDLRAIKDEPDVLVTVNLPSTIHGTKQRIQWRLSLKENDPVTLSTEICVLEAGSWAIYVSISSYFDNGELMYGDREVIGILSSEDTGKVLLEKDITFSQQKATRDAPGVEVRIDPSDCSRP